MFHFNKHLLSGSKILRKWVLNKMIKDLLKGSLLIVASLSSQPAINNRNTRTRCEICSKSPIKIPERRQWRVFIVNFEHISHLVLVFLLLALSKWMAAGLLFIILLDEQWSFSKTCCVQGPLWCYCAGSN